jgi:hypothetical protein
MRFKFTLIAAALLISAPTLAQQAAQPETPNFVLGHGFFPPAAQPSSDYPPGHAMTDAQASLRGATERAANSRNETDKALNSTATTSR